MITTAMYISNIPLIQWVVMRAILLIFWNHLV